MPISGSSSYLPTIDAFTAHWEDVNSARAELTLPPLVLRGGRTVNGLLALRGNLAQDRTALETKRNDQEISRAVAKMKQTGLLGRLAQVRDHALNYWQGEEGGGIGSTVPEVPGESAAWPNIESALVDIKDVWARINGTVPAPAGVTLPLKLLTAPTPAVPNPPLYEKADFDSDLEALKEFYAELEPAKSRLKTAREIRNKRQDDIRPWLVDYREAVEGALPPGHALLNSVPRYSPLPGSTPDGAEATGSWDAAANVGRLNFVPSTSASVVRHELRYVAGPDYDADDESIVASVEVGQPAVFETLAGLSVPGVTATYRIYAITADGNERASNTVSITRPV